MTGSWWRLFEGLAPMALLLTLADGTPQTRFIPAMSIRRHLKTLRPACMSAKNEKRRRKELVLLPLGGTGEIGMNCYCYGVGTSHPQWLMVDLGVKFGEESEPGIDVILPDVAFIANRTAKPRGIVLTHAHEDHIGAVPGCGRNCECPVYCTPFCRRTPQEQARRNMALTKRCRSRHAAGQSASRLARSSWNLSP